MGRVRASATSSTTRPTRTASASRPLAYHFLGGLKKHAKAYIAVTAPTVNSYKRLTTAADTPTSGATWSPIYVSHGRQQPHPDAAAARAATSRTARWTAAATRTWRPRSILAAGLDGIEHHIDPGPAQRRQPLHALVRGAQAAQDRAPARQPARRHAEPGEGQGLRAALGNTGTEDYIDYFVKTKQEEWTAVPRAGHAVGGQELPDAVLGTRQCPRGAGGASVDSAHTAPGNCCSPGTAAGGRSQSRIPVGSRRCARMCGLCGFLYKDADRGRCPSAARCTRCSCRWPAAAPTPPASPSTARPRPDSYVVRARIEANSRHARAGARGARSGPAASATTRSRARTCAPGITYAGDLGDLTDRIEAEPHVEVFSIGRSMEIVKEVGDADAVEAAVAVLGLRGQPRHRPHAHGDRVARRRRPLPPVLGAAVPRHLGRPQRPHHELPQAPPQAREPGPPVRHRQRLRGDRGLHRRQARARREPRGCPARVGRTTSTAPSPT